MQSNDVGKKIRIHKVFEPASVVLNATLSIFAMIHVLTTIILKRATTKNHVAKHFFWHENPHSIVMSYIQKISLLFCFHSHE